MSHQEKPIRKVPSYSNIMLTLILAIMGWNARATYDLAQHMSGMDKEIVFNKSDHVEFKLNCANLGKDIKRIDRKVLINTLRIEAIKHEDELEIIEE